MIYTRETKNKYICLWANKCFQIYYSAINRGDATKENKNG